MQEIILGGAFCVGDNVTAFDIMPNRFKSSDKLDEKELAMVAFADFDPQFAKKALDGIYKIIVAGRNFGGGGKTIEGPVFALKGAGISIVVADSFSRFFFRNSINNSFPILVSPGISSIVQTGDQLEINIRTATIKNLSSNTTVTGRPISPNLIAIISEGGLVNYTKKILQMKSSTQN